MKSFKFLLLTISFVYAAVSGHTINGFQCSRYCKESGNDFGYKNGWVYTYTYKANISTFINSSSNLEPKIENKVTLNALVDIYALSTCDFKMKISATQALTIHDQSVEPISDLDKKLMENPIHFSFSKGKIDTVCSVVDEQTEILNVKKAILSSFQNSMQNLYTHTILYETDISGTCETEYEVIRPDPESGYTIKKTKNLRACTHRSEKYFSWQSEPYNKEQATSSPLLRSAQTCLQTYTDEMVLKSSACEEKHLLKPFSNGEQGAMTLATQNLQFVLSRQENSEATFSLEFEQSTLLFKMPAKPGRKTNEVAQILELLRQLEVGTKDGVRPDTSGTFFQLVELMVNTDKEELVKIFDTVRGSKRRKRFFIDALPLISTVDGIEVMKKLKSENELTQTEFDSCIRSLMFVKNPKIEMLDALTSLIKAQNSTKQNSMLTISSLLHRYCKVNKCEKSKTILNILSLIEEPLKQSCIPVDPSSHGNILLALKAIGNAGQVTSHRHLQRCFMKSDTPTDLRLAAIAAHRRIGCGRNENLETLQDLFVDRKENTEVRIASYLAIMQCSSYAVFSKVRNVLYEEETNQVGSFVWTHITNLQETSSQWKQKLKHLVENEFMKNKFDTDMRKYSRNYEVSNYFDSINTGVSLESNVIFTSESYLPKSAMFNLTLDLFGETVNVFEAGARITGFENVVEQLFGPDGYFPENSVMTLLENARNEHELTEKIQKMGDNLRLQNVLKKDPSGLLYAKVFGSEIAYTHFKNLNDIIGEPINTKRALDLAKKIFKNSDIDYTKTFKFLDSTYTIPTVIGFPMEVSVNGTATLGLTVKGKIDVEDFWKHKLRVEGKIYPSANVQVVGTLTVDAFSTKTGIKSVSSLNSNTYIDGHVYIDGGKLVDLKLNIPKKRMDIIDVQSNLFLFKNEKSKELADVTTNVESLEGCTRQVFGQVTGLEVCSNLKYVNASQERFAPYFPLTGSFKYSLNIKKIDNFDSYHIRWSSNLQPDSELRFISFYADTPNARVNRKFNASIYLNSKERELEAKLESPFATFALLGKIDRQPERHGFYLRALFNSREIIFLETCLQSLRNGYKVDSKLNFRERALALVSGAITNERNRYAIYLTVNDILANLTITPHLGNFEISSQLNSKELEATLNATVGITPDFLSVTSKCRYNYRKKRDDMSLDFHLGKLKRIELHKDVIYFNLTSSAYPFYNTLISFNSQRSDMYLDNSGIVTLFGVTWETRQLLKLQKPKGYIDAALICTLTCHQKHVDYQVILSHNSSETDFNVHGLLQLNKVQRIEILTKYEVVNDDRHLEFLLYYPKQAWTLKGELKTVHLGVIEINLRGQLQVNATITNFLKIEGTYINSTKNQLQNYTLGATVDFIQDRNFWKSPWIVNSSLQYSKEIFRSSASLQLKDDKYSTRLTWTKDSFITDLQLNDKKLLFVNGKKDKEETSLTLGLHIYQNFEFSIKVQPYVRLDMKFYWDKGRDLHQKFCLTINGNNNGFYVMNLEYPNQRIVASFTLLPTQVTLNVTWGVKLSQKMYLKVGNRIYDVGGVWFGELETPFKYFEKQKFKLKYLVLKYNLEVETNVSWRDHKINLMAAGSRSASHLNGFLEINTTLPQVSKLGVALNHDYNSSESIHESKTKASFEYNEHQITGQSIWSSRGLNVSSTFELVSPTNTIKPINGVLNVNNNQTTNYLNCLFSWQGYNVSAEYKFENYRSYIIVNTPFRGVERTKLEYALVRDDNELVIEIEVSVLRQLNYVLLKWKDKSQSVSDVHFEIISPMTGIYQLYLKHSTLFGYLEEDLIVKQGKENETILALQISGNVNSIFSIDAKLSVKALGHGIAVDVVHTPLSSIIEAKWDEHSVMSSFEITTSSEMITHVTWNINSTLFDDSVRFRYRHVDLNCFVLFTVPGGYELENNLNYGPAYSYAENNFRLLTPSTEGGLFYLHTYKQSDFKNKIDAHLNDVKLNYSSDIHFMQDSYIIDSCNMNLNTTWHEPILLNFTLKKENSESKMTADLIFKWDSKTTFELNSFMKYDPVGNNVFMLLNGSHMYSVNIEGYYNVDKRQLKLTGKFKHHTAHASVEWPDSFLLFIDVSSRKLRSFLLDVEFKPSRIKIESTLPAYRFRNLIVITRSNVVNVNADCGWQNYSVSLSTGTEEAPFKGYLRFKENAKQLSFQYAVDTISTHSFGLESNITSTFDFIHNGSINLKYFPNNVAILLEGNSLKHLVYFNSSFKVSSTSTKILAIGHLVTSFKLDNAERLNLSLKTDNEMVIKDNTTAIRMIFEGNESELNFSGYSDDQTGVYRSDFFIKNKEQSYGLKYDLHLERHVLELAALVEASGFKLECEIDSRKRKDNDYYNTRANWKVRSNAATYVLDIRTKYYAILWSRSEIDFVAADYKYSGLVNMKIGGMNTVLNATFGNSTFRNDFDCAIDLYNNWSQMNGSLILGSDLMELLPLKLTFDSDIKSKDKKLTVKYFSDLRNHSPGVVFDVYVNASHIQASLNLPNKISYISVSGTHQIKEDELSIDYLINYELQKIRLEIFHVVRDHVQTKIDISTTLQGWEKTVFESKIDADKVRTFFSYKNHQLSVVANKHALFKGKELLSVQYNGEQLLIIWSGREQSYLITSTRYVQYRLGIEYVTDPRIYAFSILRNGENLISFILQNTSNTSYVNFKGKLMTTTLFPRYSNISLLIHADYHLRKSFQFSLQNRNEKLLEIIWLAKDSPEEHDGYFKFHSQIPMLQSFEINPYLNTETDLLLKFKVTFMQYGRSKEFLNYILIPVSSRKIVLSSLYPCEEYGQCDFHLHLNTTCFDFHWSSPIENWRNISFKSSLELQGSSLSGLLFFEKNSRKFDSNWNLRLDSNNFHWSFITTNNLIRRFENTHANIVFEGRYQFYRQLSFQMLQDSIGFRCNVLNDHTKSVQLTFIFHGQKLHLNTSFGIDKFDLIVSDEPATMNFTITKTLATPQSKSFDLLGYSGSKQCWKGKLLWSFARNFNIFGFLEGNDLSGKEWINFAADGDFVEHRGSLRFILKLHDVPSEMAFTYHSLPNFKSDFIAKQNNRTVCGVSAKHSYLNNSLDSRFSIRMESDLKELRLNYDLQDDDFRGIFLVTLSKSLEFLFKANVQRKPGQYIFENVVIWPEDQRITLLGKVENKSFDLCVTSPFTEPFQNVFKFDISDSEMDTFYSASLGNRNVSLTAKIILRRYLSLGFMSPFVGYTSGHLVASFNDSGRSVYLYIEKENLVAEFEGNVTQSEDNIHEIYLVAKPPFGHQEETFAKVQMKLNQNTMKFNSDVNWKNKNLLLNVSYDPKDLYLNVDSPFEYATKVRLFGMYSKFNDTYSVESEGDWNSLNVRFKGDLYSDPEKMNVRLHSEVKIGTLYEGKLAVRCSELKMFGLNGYFPDPSSAVDLNFDSRASDEFVELSVSVETPFDVFKSLTMQCTTGHSQISASIAADIQNEDLLAILSLGRVHESKFLGTIGFSIPQDDWKFVTELDVDLYKHGYLKVSHLRDTLISYNVSSNFEVSFTCFSEKLLEKKLYILYSNSSKRFEYYYLGNNMSIAANSGIEIDIHGLTDKPIFRLSKNEKSLSIRLYHAFLEANWDDNKTTEINLINFLAYDLYLTYNQMKSGFKIIINQAIDSFDFGRVSIIYLNNKDEFSFSTRQINFDRNITSVYKLEFVKSLEKFLIKLDQNFLLDLESSRNATKVHFLNNHLFVSDHIKCEIDLTNTVLSVLLETHHLANINVLILVNLYDPTTKLQFQYDILKGTVEIQNAGINTLQINLSKLEHSIFNFEYTIYQNSYGARIALDAFNSSHKSNFKLITTEPYLLEFEVRSPFLPDRGFAICGTSSSISSIFFSVGAKIPESIHTSDDQYLLMTGRFEHMSILVQLEVPKCDLASLLYFKTTWDYDVYKTFSEIKVASSVLGNVSVIAEFNLEEEGLDIVTHLTMPFLKSFEKFDSEFHIHRNFSPWFYVRLPNGNRYSAHVTHVHVSDRISLDAGYVWADLKSNLKLDVDKSTSALLVDIHTPFEKYRRFGLKVENAKNAFTALINVNERIYKLTSRYQLHLQNQSFRIDLETPFKRYEKYCFDFTYNSNVIRCVAFYPSLNRKIGFDYTYESNRNINLTLSLPFSISGFQYCSFSSRFRKTPGYYVINAIGELNEHSAELSLLCPDIDSTYLESERKLKFNLETSCNNSVFLLFDDASNFLNSSITFNGSDIWTLDYSYSNAGLYFSCNSVWKSIKLDYRNSYKQLNIFAKIWDTLEPNYQHGVHLISADRNFVGLYLPSRVIEMTEQYLANEIDEYYHLRLAWNKDDAFGLTIKFSNISQQNTTNINSLIDLELPFRTFSLYCDIKVIEFSDINSHLILKWDEDESSQISWKSSFLDNKLQSRIETSALDHEITLDVDFSKFNMIPSFFTLQIKYAPEIEKLIELELFYDKIVTNNVSASTKRIFVLRQPSSRINYAVTSETTRTKEYANITVFLEYVDYVLNKPDNVKASLEIGHTNFQISGLIETKRNSLFVFTKADSGVHHKGLQMQLKVNDKEPLHLDYVYNFQETSPSYVMSMTYGSDRRYNMYAGLPSKREITAKLVHNIYGSEYVYGLFTLKLNTTSLLWMKLLWKNNLIEQFSRAVISEYSDLKFIVEATGRQLIDVIDKDFGKTLVSDGREIRTKLANYGHDQKRKITSSYAKFVNQIRAICDNEKVFYCQIIKQAKLHWDRCKILKNLTKPIMDMTDKFYENILQIFHQAYGSVRYIFDEIEEAITKLEDVKKLKENAKELLKRSINDARKSIKDMETLAVQLLCKLEEYLDSMKNTSEELFDPLLGLLDDFVAYFENKLAFVQIVVLDTLDTIQQYVQNLEETKRLLSTFNSFVTWLEGLHLMEVVESVSDFAEAVLGTLVNNAKLIIDDYRPYVDTLYAAVFGNYEDINRLPHFNDFKEFINNIYQRTIWIWNYHNVIENVKAYFHRLSSKLINYLNVFANDFSGVNDQENILGQFDYTFRPDVGVIEVSQPLPVEWESFDKAPSFEQYPLYQQIHNKIDSIKRERIDQYRNALKTYFYYLAKPVFSPPTNNFAMIVGNSHYVTFNNKHFDFVGTCSYLLASDFYSNSVSVIINYNVRNGVYVKKSTSFVSLQNKIDVQSDFTILLNNRKVSLPLSVGDFLLTRENENILIEHSQRLRASCNIYFDYCTIELSEWLFGKTAGLLGTLDNEKITMTLPNGDRTADVEEFAYSWKISDNCDVTNHTNDTIDTTGSYLVNKLFDTLCGKIFLNGESTLSTCFSVVDPTPFYRMCLLDIRDRLKPTVCRSTAAYKKQCANRLVEVVMPNICVTCPLYNNIGTSETIFDGHNPKSIDVVFIQELDCARNAISTLPKKLNAALSKNGYVNNKFSVVGYGGASMMRPHVYSFGDKIWADDGNVKINTTLTLSKKFNDKYTAGDAIKYAAELQFRPAVTKMFLLVQCEPCEEMDNSPEIFNMLGDKDVTLHVLKPKPFAGIDIDYEIMAIDASDRLLSKEGVLRNSTNNDKVMDQLKDMCSGLALSTSGTVADSALFRNNKYMKLVWASFVASTARQSSCQKCKCASDSNGVGKIECTRCMSPIVKQLLNEYELQAMEY